MIFTWVPKVSIRIPYMSMSDHRTHEEDIDGGCDGTPMSLPVIGVVWQIYIVPALKDRIHLRKKVL